ncbi:MAG: NADAR family protein [Pseudomonadota bacterium]
MFIRFCAVLFTAALLSISCTHTPPTYPDHWWVGVSGERPRWEILPDQVKPPQVILSKRNELGVLSNFAATPFLFQGSKYASLEGFWQATKFPENKNDPRFALAKWPYTRQQVSQMVAFEAKRAGDFASRVMKKNKIDWVSFQGQRMSYRAKGESDFYRLIRSAMVEKVQQNTRVKKILMATGDLVLKPDHHQKADAPLAWKYFDIYMSFREQLKAGKRLQ